MNKIVELSLCLANFFPKDIFGHASFFFSNFIFGDKDEAADAQDSSAEREREIM